MRSNSEQVLRRARFGVPMLIGCALALGGPAAAQSAMTPSGFVGPAPKALLPGRAAQLRVQIDLDTECHISGPGLERDLAARDPAILIMSWRTPRRLRAGRYVLLLECGDPEQDGFVQHTMRLTARGVTGKRFVRILAATAVKVRVERLLPIDVEAYVDQYWAERKDNVLGLNDGSCTQYVLSRRPDLVEAAEKANVRRWFAGGRTADLTVLSWNADSWVSNAQLAGLAVTSFPRAGAVEVSPEGTDAGSGHVAYVESVDADGGGYTVTEWGVNGTRFQLFTDHRMPDFVEGQPAGYGHHTFIG